MPYVPSYVEARRLRDAIAVASFREGERVAWLVSLMALVVLDVSLSVGAVSWTGIAASGFGFFILYWRLRGAHLSRRVQGDTSRLLGIGLRNREQRAFTALMFRHDLTGRNPLAERPEHDPLAGWRGPVRAPAPAEDGS